MGRCILIKRLFRQQSLSDISRRHCIRHVLKNLSDANDFNLKCWIQFAPQEYQLKYSIEEVIEKINRSKWDGERIFSSEALNPIHKNSKVAYFPTKDAEVIKVMRAEKDAFYIGHYIFHP